MATATPGTVDSGPRPTSLDAGIGAPLATGTLRCPYGAGDAGGSRSMGRGSTEVVYDKTCSVAEDCAIRVHGLDCCGTMIALGVNQQAALVFDDLDAGGTWGRSEKVCPDAHFDVCLCDGAGLFAENGEGDRSGSVGKIAVRCVSGSCMTYVVPDGGRR
jgi:hypothetical protein